MSLLFGILEEPLWLQAWVGWLMVANLASLAFWKQREARVVFWIFLANVIFMSVLCEINGYNRLLGLSHVVFWTPLLVYLIRRLPRMDRASSFGQWIVILILTDTASLLIDYADVTRYILGDRG
jgi:hypothetical protein